MGEGRDCGEGLKALLAKGRAGNLFAMLTGSGNGLSAHGWCQPRLNEGMGAFGKVKDVLYHYFTR